MEDVIAVSAGTFHTLAITYDNTLWAWGSNYSSHRIHIFGMVIESPAPGLLGDGTDEDSNVPVMIMENIASVSADRRHTLAVTTDGYLLAWGDIWDWQWDWHDVGRDDGYWELHPINPDFVVPLVPVKIMDGILLPN